MMRAGEFKKGDVVTFRAYFDQNIKAKVIETFIFEDSPEKQNRYQLEGISEHLVTITTGESIKESKFFRCPTEHPIKW